VIGYWEIVGCYDHAIHVRMVIFGELQILFGVFPILTTNLDELDEKHPQRLKYHEIMQK
jgi:hypothetical protein